MDRLTLTLLIQKKLADGRLPHNHIPRLWGGPGNGEICDGCNETVTKSQMIMEGLSPKSRGVQLHVTCFHVWDAERQLVGHEPSGTADFQKLHHAPPA
jgi:hypothetical protein